MAAFTCKGSHRNFANATWLTGSDSGFPVLIGTNITPSITEMIAIIIILWTTIGLLISLHDHFLLHTQNSLGVSPDYSFFQSALRNMTAGFIGAILGGSLLVFYINVKYQDKPYGYTIVTVSISFIIIIAIISVILGVIFVPKET